MDPIFLVVCILVYLLATVLVEFVYARRLVREAEGHVTTEVGQRTVSEWVRSN